jgi:hypothetical protein
MNCKKPIALQVPSGATKAQWRAFFAWYERCEQRPFTFATLTPIVLVSYLNEVQRTQRRTTSTVNGHLSALRVWCATLHEKMS